MAGSFQYNPVDNAVGKLSRMQEYLDVGYSTTLEIALDIEECNESGKTTAEIEQLKDITLEYVKMEKELKQWLQAAETTKTAFQEEHRNAKAGNVPSIEEIFMNKLNETEENSMNESIQEHPNIKEFVKQVWNVHHSGQPLPTDQNATIDSDIMIAQASEESVICPLTQKQMVEPVRSKKCHHSFEKAAILHHIRVRQNRVRCPVGGCAHYVTEADIEPNSSLAFRIKRLQRKQ
ncbi:E3 SUMO-protein ligase NSE2-like [Dendronephthya gigantea]|uniref:E3 SUMO-protein ligase NSE2-like n=1 Tax=Dendronephthya gigantea TaxID=151771 RepID=UPI00106D07F6|nr:E3 SUMO-protein ligase NSE2-like [Dendronephthya gigantea]